MVLLDSSIEIAAPPEKVREVFLDWPKYPEWNPSHIKTITSTSSPPKSPSEIQPGDKLKVQLEGMTFSPSVLKNSPEEFLWKGSLPGIFTGDHHFRFKKSDVTEGHCRFEQGEEFSGLLSLLMKGSWGKGTGEGFGKFNEDLKKRVESLG